VFNIDWEPFNGMARRPWLEFWGLILSIAAFATVFVLSIFAYCHTDSDVETRLVQTHFTACAEEKGGLHLSAADGKTYTIENHTYYNGRFDQPESLCSGERYTIWVDNDGNICAMKDPEDRNLITAHSYQEAKRNSQKQGIALGGILLLLTVAYFVLALVVSRNSEWYPAWLVKLLFARPFED